MSVQLHSTDGKKRIMLILIGLFYLRFLIKLHVKLMYKVYTSK